MTAEKRCKCGHTWHYHGRGRASCARCPCLGFDLKTPQGESSTETMREPVVTEPQGNAGESPATLPSNLRAFDEWVKNLSKPILENIRDGLENGRSITREAFLAGWRARADFETPALTKRLRDARLNWAMACPCTCKACDEFYEAIRDICSSAKAGEPQPTEADDETPCAVREDGQHCECWYGGNTCCGCGDGDRSIGGAYPTCAEVRAQKTTEDRDPTPEHLLRQGYRSGKSPDVSERRCLNGCDSMFREHCHKTTSTEPCQCHCHAFPGEAWNQPGECTYPICGCKGKKDCKRVSLPRNES